jgi:ATP-binding cassette subfamily B protein
VLADGTIVEQGSHDDLITAGGRYARLFQLQAQGYSDSYHPDGSHDHDAGAIPWPA